MKMQENKDFRLTEYIYQLGKKIGWIELKMNHAAKYVLTVYFFGISCPIEQEYYDDYILSLHKMVIKKNKYSY